MGYYLIRFNYIPKIFSESGENMSELLHNEFPPESLEGKDLAHLLHPTTNLKLHRQQGPSIHEKAEGVYLWDFAAGICLVKEAGGILNDIDISTNENLKIIASSPYINDKLIKKLDNF